MAKKINKFPARPKPPVRTKYPWHRWLGGGIYRLTRGVDYDGTSVAMATGARKAAARQGVRIRAAATRDTVTIERVG